jgi:transcriptional regulator with XRE-family HTH domain
MTNNKWIRHRLIEIGKTQTDLGKTIKLDKAQVSRMLDGKRRVQIDEIERLAIFLEMPTVELLRQLGVRL